MNPGSSQDKNPGKLGDWGGGVGAGMGTGSCPQGSGSVSRSRTNGSVSPALKTILES